MKHIAIVALCCLSNFAQATDYEEMVVVARRIEITIQDLNKNHIQHPITGNWHYVAEEVKPNKVELKREILAKIKIDNKDA